MSEVCQIAARMRHFTAGGAAVPEKVATDGGVVGASHAASRECRPEHQVEGKSVDGVSPRRRGGGGSGGTGAPAVHAPTDRTGTNGRASAPGDDVVMRLARPGANGATRGEAMSSAPVAPDPHDVAAGSGGGSDRRERETSEAPSDKPSEISGAALDAMFLLYGKFEVRSISLLVLMSDRVHVSLPYLAIVMHLFGRLTGI